MPDFYESAKKQKVKDKIKKVKSGEKTLEQGAQELGIMKGAFQKMFDKEKK
jgi:hypothetical protein